MLRTRSTTTSTTHRRRRAVQGADTRLVVTQITRLVAANESLKLENARLQALNEQLRGELTEIGAALGSLTGGRRGRGRRGASAFALPEAKARRNAALVKARAARAETLAAARAAVSE